jgi:hypothetical protein
VNVYAGNGVSSFSGDGLLATSSSLSNPQDIWVDSVGNVFIADTNNCRIRKVSVDSGVMLTIAGLSYCSYDYSGTSGSIEVPATSVSVVYPSGIWGDSIGNIYIVERDLHRIRRVSESSGTIVTVAGRGYYYAGYNGDDISATSAYLYYPNDVWGDSNGVILICDTYNHAIREVNVSGIIRTIAGKLSLNYGSVSGYNGDGQAATSATLYYPYSVSGDTLGNVYIADTSNNRIRKVDRSSGIISTVVGMSGGGYSADGGVAISSYINSPMGVWVNMHGDVYYSDGGYNLVRKVDSSGILTTVAGHYGYYDYSSVPDGVAASSSILYSPKGIFGNVNTGDLYISDSDHNVIRILTKSVGATSYVPCPVGTYYNASTSIAVCSLCPIGTYSSVEGSLSCIPIPAGNQRSTTTINEPNNI